jgi:hypothetical protein
VTNGLFVNGGLSVSNSFTAKEASNQQTNTNQVRVTGGVTVSNGLLVNGNFNGDSATVQNPIEVMSDVRVKEDIEQLKGVLDRLLQISSVEFEYDLAKYNGRGVDSKRHIGFIAQEIQELFPEAVFKHEVLTVDYIGMIGVVIEGLKELYEKCANCDMEIADQIEELRQWDKKISAADIQYTKKRERIKEEQDSLYEKYEALLNATKLLEEEVTTLFDELLLDDLEKVFDLDYFIDIGDNADTKETEKLNP